MNRTLYTLLLLLFASTAVFGQSGEIQGKVLNESGEGIPFANVAVFKEDVLTTGATTDFDGQYSISGLRPGTYDVEASYQGNKVKIAGITVATGVVFLDDITLSEGIKLDDVVITYEAPLVDRGNTRDGAVVTKEDIKNIPSRNVNTIAATKAGVYQSDDGGSLSIKGSRSDGTEYIIDGVRVSGSLNIPQGALEQIEVITGGVDAKYGDATGGLVTVTTRGPSRQYNAGLEVVTSQFLDNYGYNLVNFSLTGPILQKNRGTDTVESKLGFLLAGEVLHQKDPDPSAVQLYNLNDESRDFIQANPLQPAQSGLGFEESAEFLGMDDLVEAKYKENAASIGTNIVAKFDYKLSRNTNLTLGGNWRYFRENQWRRDFAIFNSDNNPLAYTNTYRGYLRFTQRFPERRAEGEGSGGILGNAYYSLQVDYTKFQSSREDEVHGRNPWNYGYIGEFETSQAPVYQYIGDAANSPLGLVGYHLAGYADTSVTFNPGTANPLLTNYTTQYYDQSPFDPNTLFQIQAEGGLLNGIGQTLSVYSLFYSAGQPWFNYVYQDDDQFGLNFQAAVDLKNQRSKVASKHAIEFGLEFQQRVERFYGISPTSLWTIGRQLANNHLSIEQSESNSFLIIDGQQYTYQQYLDDPTLQFGTFDSIFFPTVAGSGQSSFDSNLRDVLAANGYNIGETDFIDIDALPLEIFSLDLFSADELLNNGNSLVSYYGYDYLGNKLSSQPSFNGFFQDKDANDEFTRSVDAFRPVYTAGYIQDRFNFNDIIFRVGVRVDRYDANRKVLKDPFSIYDRRSANEVDASVYENTYGSGVTGQPAGIGDEYAVYVDDFNSSNPTIVGYRNERTWYNAAGEEIADPQSIASASSTGTIQPYLVSPTDDIKSEDFDPNSAFQDYEPQVTVMPRIAFSFPISKEEGRESLFFAHYDVLSQRPAGRSSAVAYDYFFLQDNQGALINNPNLKPTKTIDYQVGFQQQISDASVVKLSAFYKEVRDEIQVIDLPFAYPIQYQTYGNIDFGTVKGLTFAYDIARRVNNIKLSTSYTLQFADGTGSNDRSQVNLVGAGQPNLRSIVPLSFDSRHNLKLNFDYRWASGDAYDGPVLGGSNIFANTGFNLQMQTRSGEPYTRQTNARPTAQFGVQGRSTLEGKINGSRLPWHFDVDFKVDKSFVTGLGSGRELGFNIYLWVQNVLDARNILAVYAFSGNPDDDGYVSSSIGQEAVNAQLDPVAFTDLYGIKANNPNNFTRPRTIRLGVQMNF